MVSSLTCLRLGPYRDRSAAYLEAFSTARAVLTDTSSIDTEMEELQRELEVVAGLTKKCIEENSSSTQNQGEYAARYNGYVDRYEKAKDRHNALTALRQEKLSKAKAIDRFIATVSKREDLLTEFDTRLWLSLVDYAEVRRDGTLIFHFCDGTQITE